MSQISSCDRCIGHCSTSRMFWVKVSLGSSASRALMFYHAWTRTEYACVRAQRAPVRAHKHVHREWVPPCVGRLTLPGVCVVQREDTPQPRPAAHAQRDLIWARHRSMAATARGCRPAHARRGQPRVHGSCWTGAAAGKSDEQPPHKREPDT